MDEKDSKNNREEIEKKSLIQSNLTKRVATSAIFIAVGIVLAMFNPFAFVEILGGPKVFPMAHFINGITGVLIGISFACVTSLGIAIFRFPVGIGSIHAFHGGISGAFVVGLVSYILRKKKPNYVEYAALKEQFEAEGGYKLLKPYSDAVQCLQEAKQNLTTNDSGYG